MEFRFPLVSVGVPVYNGCAFVIETLESIAKQSYPNIEIIIVDDCSSDNSYELCAKWAESSVRQVVLMQNKVNQGTPLTCNIILNKVSGDYFQLLGQDDILLPTKIASDIDFFESSSEDTALLFSNVMLIDELGAAIRQTYFDRINFNGDLRQNIYKQLIVKNFIPAPTAIMRTRYTRTVGGYDNTLVYEDWYMWLMLASRYKVKFNDICLTKYRIHSSSVMSNRAAAQVLRTTTADYRMFSILLSATYIEELKDLILTKIKELVIYSFLIGDKNVAEKMKLYLSKKIDVKVLGYFILHKLGFRHPGSWRIMRRRILN